MYKAAYQAGQRSSGEQTSACKKSLAYSLTYPSPERRLTGEEVLKMKQWQGASLTHRIDPILVRLHRRMV